MTEEELNKLEAMARPIEGATSSMLIPGYYVLELVRLARVGLTMTPTPVPIEDLPGSIGDYALGFCGAGSSPTLMHFCEGFGWRDCQQIGGETDAVSGVRLYAPTKLGSTP